MGSANPKGNIVEVVAKAGKEVYAALSALVTGDAMTAVKSIANGNGWEA